MLSKNQYICCFGEVLWDMFPTGKMAGGAPMNVATHLQNLGIDSAMMSRVGNDELGKEIKAFLAEKNCSTQWIQSDSIQQTGVVKVKLSMSSDASYQIVFPVAWDFIALSAEILELVENAYAIVFGTLATRNSTSKNTLFELLKKAKLKVFDVNLRAPHYDLETVELLLKEADIVKMNEDELDIIAKKYQISDQNDQERMTFLKQKFDLKSIILTQGAKGAMLLNDTDFYKNKGYKVKVLDTVGSGDAFLAGFLKNLYEGKSAQNSLDYACALGSLVATYRGANPPIKEENILEFIEKNTKKAF